MRCARTAAEADRVGSARCHLGRAELCVDVRFVALIAPVKNTLKGPLRDILARNMRTLRAERGLSQVALARDCGINRAYLSSVERSQRNVSIDNIEKIANGLRIDAWRLLKDG